MSKDDKAKRLFRISPQDNVAVAFTAIEEGTELPFEGDTVRILENIKPAHKVAIKDIREGEPVIKYGAVIGIASRDIKRGEHVHVHNIRTAADDRHEYEYSYDASSILPGKSDRTFLGYKRKSEEAGVRNYIGVISGSFCTNPHLRQFAEAANRRHPKTADFDGFMPLCHDGGCGYAGDDVVRVLKIVADLMMNPNFGAFLFVELGCEITPFEKVKPYLKDVDEDRIAFIRLQDEPDEYEKAAELLDGLYKKASADRRTACPLSDLHVALHCGASDAFSGLTANPLLGRTAEKLVQCGAKVTLTEVTEIIGAERELMKRAADEKTFGRLVDLINWQHSYLERYGQTADANPSLGNKEGGISTIEEKSMGCVHKAGGCAVTDVCQYTRRVEKRGLNVVYGTGNDVVGLASQMAAGATMFLFSTGRGTPVAAASPTIKVTSNTAIFEKKRSWADFDAGRLMSGSSMDQLSDELFELLIDTAEGRYIPQNEKYEYFHVGIFHDGVVL